MVHNPFSPLSDLGDGVVDEFVVGEDHVEVQKSHHHVDTMSLKYRRATTDVVLVLISNNLIYSCLEFYLLHSYTFIFNIKP